MRGYHPRQKGTVPFLLPQPPDLRPDPPQPAVHLPVWKSTPTCWMRPKAPSWPAAGGGFGAGYGSYSTNVPGGRSGYSGASRGYLNSEYNARPRGGLAAVTAAALPAADTKAPTIPAAATMCNPPALAPAMAAAITPPTPPRRGWHLHAGGHAVRRAQKRKRPSATPPVTLLSTACLASGHGHRTQPPSRATASLRSSSTAWV